MRFYYHNKNCYTTQCEVGIFILILLYSDYITVSQLLKRLKRQTGSSALTSLTGTTVPPKFRLHFQFVFTKSLTGCSALASLAGTTLLPKFRLHFQFVFTKSAMVSTCTVFGNISTHLTRSTRYPPATRISMSLAKLDGLQEM